jgi:hypothetical protein
MSIKYDTGPSLPLRWAALVVVTLSIAYSLFAEWIGPGADVATVSRRYQNLFTPAPFAFAIWTLIYAGFLGVCIAGLLPSRRSMPIFDRIAPPLMLANVFGATWIASFQSDLVFASLLLVLGMLLIAAWMFALVSRASDVGLARFPLTLPFALFLGWMCVATLANFGAAFVAMGYAGDSAGARALTVLALSIATVAGIGVGVRYRQFVVPAVVAWASYAIAVADRHVDRTVATVAILAALACSIAAIVIGLRRTSYTEASAWPMVRGRRTGLTSR